MRAVRIEEFGGPEVLVPVEVPDPVAGPGEVLVRAAAAGAEPCGRAHPCRFVSPRRPPAADPGTTRG